MKNLRGISIGGWVFLVHFLCVTIVFLLPFIPQPKGSITDGSHWFWGYLDFSERLFFLVTLPVSTFMTHPRDSGLWLFDQPITEWTFVPFCVILALNSLLIGYTAQLLIRLVRRPRAAHSTGASDEEFRKLLDEHRKGQV